MEHNHMLARPRRSDSPPSSHEKQHLLLHAPKHKLQPEFESQPDHHRKQILSPYSPPSYAQAHDAASLSFPNVPTTELPPIQPHGDHGAASNNNTLPSLAYLAASQPPPQPHQQPHPQFQPRPQPYAPSQPSESSCSPPPPQPNNWPSLNPLTAFYAPGHAKTDDTPNRMDLDATSSGTMSTASPERFYEGRATSLNLDDPDVRLAAEALGDLRADFVSSPPNRQSPLPVNSPARLSRTVGPEPLLSLLTTSHPLIANTIEGATSVYNNSKNFSPKFRTGAEYVEGYLGPIATKFGSVSRVTGVEGGVRWFLGSGRVRPPPTSDLEAGDGGSNKRRKVDTYPRDVALDSAAEKTDADLYGFTRDRRTSMSTVDTLPAYDEFRSPAYSETADQNRVASRSDSIASAAWPHRLILSTSGLSIAMRDESLRSLKYCLHWLRWANEHIAMVITALNTTLEQYERSASGSGSQDAAAQNGSGQTTPHPTQAQATAESGGPQHDDQGELVARITALKSDVLKTLNHVITMVSKYAGGALPENAQTLVHRHLVSLPHRFRLATKQDPSTVQQGNGSGEEEVREGAQRVLVLAKEGLDMMAQVSGVLDGTIVSAEEWCERLGKKKEEEQEASVPGAVPNGSATPPVAGAGADEDTTMG